MAAKALGYKILNPNDPPNIRRRMTPVDPIYQAAAEKILDEFAEDWRRVKQKQSSGS